MSTTASVSAATGRTKVAICITGLEVGGAETFLAELLKFKPGDIEVRVFSLIDGGLIGDRIAALDINVTGLHMQAGRPSIRSLFLLVAELREFRPDVVHTWLYHADLVGGVAAKMAGVRRVVWHLHNSDLSPTRVRLMTRLVVRSCAVLSHWIPEVILSCSEAAVRVHVARGYSAKRFVVVPNGVDTQRFAPSEDARASVREEFGLSDDLPLVGLVARVDPQKNHHGFFDAVRAFFDRGGDANFLLLGRDVTPDHWQLSGWRAATGRPDRIVMAGQREDVPRLMAALDVATSCSLGEAFPLVLIEAMSCGVPCATTDVGDSALIVSDTGAVVPPDDAGAMADAWLGLLAMPRSEREALGARARDRVLANYRIECVAQRTWDLYRGTLGSVSTTPPPNEARGMRVAYLSLQAVAQGQDTWAAVTEVITGWERAGWSVDLWFPHYPESGAPGPFGRARAMARLQRELGRMLVHYDALYVRGHTMAYPISHRAAARGIPVIQECNGTYEDLFIAWPAAKLARPLFEHMQRSQFRHADLVFCGTEQQRQWLRSETGHERIMVSPNGANTEIFRPDSVRRPGLPERFVLFFGQFAPWQGIEVLIEAKSDPAWPLGVDLVFIGDGERRAAVEEAVAASGGGIHYFGRLPYAELPGVIAHCVASTSTQFTSDRGDTGFSALKLYESMSCGVPVIGTDYPGVGDVISDYGCGVVVPPGDAHALALAAAYLAEHPAEAAEMGARGRSAIERECSWAARAEQRRQAIETIVRERYDA